MFSTCLFCHASLGANQSIEHFPVGRRLAFDTERGRLWAVCPGCSRWNLTPLEERWEAIEECERAYRDTKQRVSTDNIALAGLRDGTDLVRIGRPMLPELSAWRYGEQLGKRRTRHRVLNTLGGSLTGGFGFAAGLALTPVLAQNYPYASVLIMGGGVSWIIGHRITDRPLAQVRVSDGQHAGVHAADAQACKVSFDEDGTLHFHLHARVSRNFGVRRVFSSTRTQLLTFTGDDARRALSAAIVAVNHEGAKTAHVQAAVREVETGVDAQRLLRSIADQTFFDSEFYRGVFRYQYKNNRERFLALEMLLHEEDERRAMAGELGELYSRWEEAERIAKIADGALSTVPATEPR